MHELICIFQCFSPFIDQTFLSRLEMIWDFVAILTVKAQWLIAFACSVVRILQTFKKQNLNFRQFFIHQSSSSNGTLWLDSLWSYRWWGQNFSKQMWSPSPPASVPAKDKFIVEGNVGWDWSWSSKHIRYLKGLEISIYIYIYIHSFFLIRRRWVRYFSRLTNFFAESCHFSFFLGPLW